MKRCKYCGSMFANTIERCYRCGADAPEWSDFGSMAGAFGKGIVYVLLFYLAQFLVLIVYGIAVSVSFILNSTEMIDDQLIEDMLMSKSMELSVVSALLMILFLIVFYAVRKKNIFKSTKLNVSPGFAAAGVAALGVSLNYVTVFLASFLPIPQAVLEQHEEAYSNMGTGNAAVEFIAVAICAPLVEELVFRGLFFGVMRRTMPFIPAMLISSIMFGTVHGTVMAFVYASVLGFLLCYFYEVSGSLWAPVLIHFGYNSGSYLVTMTPDGSILFYALIFFAATVIAVSLGALCTHSYEKRNIRKTVS